MSAVGSQDIVETLVCCFPRHILRPVDLFAVTGSLAHPCRHFAILLRLVVFHGIDSEVCHPMMRRGNSRVASDRRSCSQSVQKIYSRLTFAEALVLLCFRSFGLVSLFAGPRYPFDVHQLVIPSQYADSAPRSTTNRGTKGLLHHHTSIIKYTSD